MTAPCRGTRLWPYRLAFWLIAAILLGMAVLLPVALRSVVDELTQPRAAA